MRKGIFTLLLAVAVGVPAIQRGPARDISNVRGDLYRARNGTWYSAFYVTPDGILLIDPISPDFASWLKGQLAERFPGVPVRYVVYSHSHFDHIEGGSVFADTARFVAQEGMLRNMDGRFPHMPGDMVDRNNNGQFELEEITIPATAHPGICGMPANFFRTHDRNADGHMTPAEYFADVRPPDIVYSERMRLTLGGKTFDLVHPGKNHANDGTVVVFSAERVAFSADFPADALVNTSLRSLPSACGNFDSHPMSDWIQSYKTIEGLDFDDLAGGHGSALFKKSDIAEARRFFEDLRDSVQKGMAEGKGLDMLKSSLLLDQYKDWAYYSRLREDNIESAYNNLRIYR